MREYSSFPKAQGTSPSDSFVSYPELSQAEESYPSVKMQSVYSTALADWAASVSRLFVRKLTL